jgi:hypothetical protein
MCRGYVRLLEYGRNGDSEDWSNWVGWKRQQGSPICSVSSAVCYLRVFNTFVSFYCILLGLYDHETQEPNHGPGV